MICVCMYISLHDIETCTSHHCHLYMHTCTCSYNSEVCIGGKSCIANIARRDAKISPPTPPSPKHTEADSYTHHSGQVISVSTMVPGFGLSILPRLCFMIRVLIRFFTTTMANLGLYTNIVNFADQAVLVALQNHYIFLRVCLLDHFEAGHELRYLILHNSRQLYTENTMQWLITATDKVIH